MHYNSLLEKIAKENNTTPKEVEIEMQKTLQAAGFDIEPLVFIALAATKVKKTIS